MTKTEKEELVQELHRGYDRFLEENPWMAMATRILKKEHVDVFLVAEDTSAAPSTVPSPEQQFEDGLMWEDILFLHRGRVSADVN